MPNRKFTPNNHNNRLVGPPRGNSLDGHAPSFSVFTFANNFNVLICIVEYVVACPSSDFPRGGAIRRLL